MQCSNKPGASTMKRSLFTTAIFFLSVALAFADNGTISVKSAYDVRTTADRLEQELLKKGMTVFTRIDHAEDAARVGKKLPPSELIIFGNPNVGAPLMQCGQSIGLDLPQKALIWKADNGEVWYTYNDPNYLAKRHHLTECLDLLEEIRGSLDKIAHTATAP
jgi:uncharacterized protein (DUF302 family)